MISHIYIVFHIIIYKYFFYIFLINQFNILFINKIILIYISCFLFINKYIVLMKFLKKKNKEIIFK